MTRKEDISSVILLRDAEFSLHTLHILEICWCVSETPRSNVIQMSEKCRKRPMSKNEDTKAVRHFEENNYQEDDLHANHNKTDSSVQCLRAFKFPIPCLQLKFYLLHDPNVFDFVFKI